MKHVSLTEIKSRLDWVLAAPSSAGRVEALVVRPAVDQRESLNQVIFSPGQGVAGDNWICQQVKDLLGSVDELLEKTARR